MTFDLVKLSPQLIFFFLKENVLVSETLMNRIECSVSLYIDCHYGSLGIVLLSFFNIHSCVSAAGPILNSGGYM